MSEAQSTDKQHVIHLNSPRTLEECVTYAKGSRTERTYHEELMRRALNDRSWFSWKSQHYVGDRRTAYILDFFCPVGNVAIEVDGDYHHRDEQRVADRVREYVLSLNHAIQVFRIQNRQIEDPKLLADFIFAVDCVADVRQMQMEFVSSITRQGCVTLRKR